MKVCIEKVQGGFAVYQDMAGAEGMGKGSPEGMAKGMREGFGQGQPGAMAEGMDMTKDQGSTVATVEEALQLAGSMLSGASQGEDADEASAEALFQSGFKGAVKQ